MKTSINFTALRNKACACVASLVLCTTTIFAVPSTIFHNHSQSRSATKNSAIKPLRDSSNWWQTAVFYEIYPRSFQDSNGDGIGDLNGITARLDYLKELGVDCLWITPFFPSPQVDFGYDVSDYEAVDSQFGTLADFDRLVSEAHRRNLKVILDFVINHTSSEHRFFKESRSSRTNPKRDWYIWRDAKPDGSEPSNWASAFGPKAWTYDEATKQYYYHFFYKEQPDLNWANREVQKAMFDALRFWLKRGVDGYRVDAMDTLFEDEALRDNPLKTTLREGSKTEYEQEYKYVIRLPRNHEIYKMLRKVVNEYGADRVIIGETYPDTIAELLPFYGTNNDEYNMPFNFFLLKQNKLDAAAFRRVVEETEAVAKGRPMNYVLSNHDNQRAFDKFGNTNNSAQNDAIAKMLATLLLTLRGAPFFYYGEEIGMKTTPPTRLEDIRDPVGKVYFPKYVGRDGERTPMQWTSKPLAGFTTGRESWLPVPPEAKTRNVEAMQRDPNSILNFYKRLIALRRQSSALTNGDYASIGNDPNIFAYRRNDTKQKMIVLLNMSDQAQKMKISDFAFDAKQTRIVLSNMMSKNAQLSESEVKLAPYEAMILETKN